MERRHNITLKKANKLLLQCNDAFTIKLFPNPKVVIYMCIQEWRSYISLLLKTRTANQYINSINEGPPTMLDDL